MKATYYKCASCGKRVSVLTNESCNIMTIIAVHCPECIHKHQVSTLKPEQLKSYLTQKGWKEVPIERKEAVKMISPQPTFDIFIPTRKGLIDYAIAMESVLRLIAAYEGRSVDDILLEVTGGKVR